MSHSPSTRTKRFWERVNKDGPVCATVGTKCWVWLGQKTLGYGFISINLHNIGCHRYSWGLHNGPIPSGLCVLHKCDNRACINPDHLFLGTKTENTADCVAKQRQARGERNRHAKLTEGQVLEIRRRRLTEGPTKLAKEYGVTYTTIRRIVKGERWKYMEVLSSL